MTTLKDFEEALREQGMNMALAILQKLRERDRAQRSIAPARRIRGRKMTPELARSILELHRTTGMTQQEIAFKVGVNQGRVNEVVKRGKWLGDEPASPEAIARDRALERARAAPKRRAPSRRSAGAGRADPAQAGARKQRLPPGGDQGQLAFGDL